MSNHNSCPLCGLPITECREHYGNGGLPDPEPMDDYWHTRKIPSMSKAAILERARYRRLKDGNRYRSCEGRRGENKRREVC